MPTPELRFMHGSHRARCDASVNKYFTGYFTIQYCTQGAVELFYGDKRHLLTECSFWPASPGPRIRFHPAPGHRWWEHRYVAFQGRLAERWAREGLYPTRPQTAPRGVGHVVLFDQMLRLFHEGSVWAHRRAVNLLEALMLELAEARDTAPASTRDGPWLEKVKLAVTSADATGDTNYAQVAERLGMGLSTLRRRFRLASGTSLHAHVLASRLGKARSLLVESDLPIKTIAEQLGYRDVFFFSRQFREKTGVSPGVFRRSRV